MNFGNINKSAILTYDKYLILYKNINSRMSIHHNKIIHRDIKPENIIKKDNVYKITNFGVSCDREDD